MTKKYNIAVGQEISFGERILKINSLDNLDFEEVDIAFFYAGSDISKEFTPKATAKNCVVIDKSSFFRLDDQVPVIVPEANLLTLKGFTAKNIIANLNCVAIPLSVDNEISIKRVLISTYQSVSGAAKAGMDEVYAQTKSNMLSEKAILRYFQKKLHSIYSLL